MWRSCGSVSGVAKVLASLSMNRWQCRQSQRRRRRQLGLEHLKLAFRKLSWKTNRERWNIEIDGQNGCCMNHEFHPLPPIPLTHLVKTCIIENVQIQTKCKAAKCNFCLFPYQPLYRLFAFSLILCVCLCVCVLDKMNSFTVCFFFCVLMFIFSCMLSLSSHLVTFQNEDAVPPFADFLFISAFGHQIFPPIGSLCLSALFVFRQPSIVNLFEFKCAVCNGFMLSRCEPIQNRKSIDVGIPIIRIWMGICMRMSCE